MFIEAAIQIAGAKCRDCNVPLQLIWIGDEAHPDLRYVECPKCNEEYVPLVLFVLPEEIGE